MTTLHLLPALLIAIPLAMLSFAGCFGSEPLQLDGTGNADAGNGEDGPSTSANPVGFVPVTIAVPTAASGLPSDFTRAETVMPGVNAFLPGRGGVCAGVANACYHSTFSTNHQSVLRASLTWTQDLNDFDLHLYRNGVLVHSSAGSAPGDSEAFEVMLPPGEYGLLVVAYVLAQDSFLLAANFAAPPTAETAPQCHGNPLLTVGPLSVGRTSC